MKTKLKKVPPEILQLIKKHKSELMAWGPDIVVQSKAKHDQAPLISDMKLHGWLLNESESDTEGGILHFTTGEI